MKHRYNFVLAALVVAVVAQAQPGPFLQADLQYATNVCSDTTYTLGGLQTGMGEVDDLDQTNKGCLASGEGQTAWMHFSIASSGMVGFTVQPTLAMSDYDFAVWGPFTDVPHELSTLPLRCSYAASAGATGLNGSSSDNSEGAGGDRFVRSIDVLSGERYVIVINNFSQNGIDFTLTWDLQDGATLECLPATAAQFTPSATLVQAGGTVNFTDQSNNYPFAWWWEFDGGLPATSLDQDPQEIVYGSPGCYDVSLTAYNSAGESTTTIVCQIEVEASTGITGRSADQFQVLQNNVGFSVQPRNIGAYTIQLIDGTGRVVKQLKTQGQHTLLGNDLPAGAYSIVLSDHETREVHRLANVR